MSETIKDADHLYISEGDTAEEQEARKLAIAKSRKTFNKHTWMTSVRKDHTLSYRAKAVAGALHEAMNLKRPLLATCTKKRPYDRLDGPNNLAVFAGTATLAPDAGMDEKTYRKGLSELEAAGRVAVKREHRKTAYVVACWPGNRFSWPGDVDMTDAEDDDLDGNTSRQDEEGDIDEEDNLDGNTSRQQREDFPPSSDVDGNTSRQLTGTLPVLIHTKVIVEGKDSNPGLKLTERSPAGSSPDQDLHLLQDEEAQEHKPTRRLALVQDDDDLFEDEAPVLARVQAERDEEDAALMARVLRMETSPANFEDERKRRIKTLLKARR